MDLLRYLGVMKDQSMADDIEPQSWKEACVVGNDTRQKNVNIYATQRDSTGWRFQVSTIVEIYRSQSKNGERDPV